MTLVIPPGFGSAALVLEGGVGTSPFITTIGVDLSAAGGDYVAAANTVMQAYSAAFLPSTSPDLTLVRCILSVGQDGGDQPTVESDFPSVPGGGSGDFAPLSVSLLLNKRTSLLGRKGRGRMFIPGVIKDNMVDISGRLLGTVVDAFDGVAEGFIDILNDPDGLTDPVVVPPVLLHSTAVPVPTPIAAMTTGPVVGTMARRIK